MCFYMFLLFRLVRSKMIKVQCLVKGGYGGHLVGFPSLQDDHDDPRWKRQLHHEGDDHQAERWGFLPLKVRGSTGRRIDLPGEEVFEKPLRQQRIGRC